MDEAAEKVAAAEAALADEKEISAQIQAELDQERYLLATVCRSDKCINREEREAEKAQLDALREELNALKDDFVKQVH